MARKSSRISDGTGFNRNTRPYLPHHRLCRIPKVGSPPLDIHASQCSPSAGRMPCTCPSSTWPRRGKLHELRITSLPAAALAEGGHASRINKTVSPPPQSPTRRIEIRPNSLKTKHPASLQSPTRLGVSVPASSLTGLATELEEQHESRSCPP